MHSMKGECLRISAFHPQIKKCTMKRMARQYLLSEGLCYLKKVFGCAAAKACKGVSKDSNRWCNGGEIRFAALALRSASKGLHVPRC